MNKKCIEKYFLFFLFFLFITECSKKEEISVKPPDNKEVLQNIW